MNGWDPSGLAGDFSLAGLVTTIGIGLNLYALYGDLSNTINGSTPDEQAAATIWVVIDMMFLALPGSGPTIQMGRGGAAAFSGVRTGLLTSASYGYYRAVMDAVLGYTFSTALPDDASDLPTQAPTKGNYSREFWNNVYDEIGHVDELDVADIKISPYTGELLLPHPNKHNVPKTEQPNILNNWKRFFTGYNYNGRHVDIYWLDDKIVITQHGDKRKVITSMGRGVGDNSPRPHERWTNSDNWEDREVYQNFHRNTQR